MIKLNTIQLNPTNPRTIKEDKFKKLCNSIKESTKFLEARPIVVKDGVIYAGNMRYRALQELGYTEVPDEWIKDVSGWTAEDIHKFIVVDNIPYGDNDWDLLANDWTKEELEEWGMDVDKWVDDEVVEDEVPEVTENPVSKLGEVYQLGRHRLMCGDSTKIEDVEKLMDGKKADMVFTDPPYGVDFQSNMRTKSKKFDVIDNDDKILTEWIPLLDVFSKGFIFIWTTWKVLDKWNEAVKPLGSLTNLIVWYKGGGGIGDLKHTFSTDYEMAMVFGRGKEITGKRLGSVWEIHKDFAGSYDHPTQKPVGLAAIAIKNTTDDKDIVLDLFLGSGSTLIACEQTNRICHGMEIDPKYCDVIRKRYAKFIGKEEEWQITTPKI